MPKKSDITRKWYIVDAEGQTLGRLASKIAHILRGKHKPTFTYHEDMGDYIIVLNADKVKISGSKEMQKEYFYHTGVPGGARFLKYADVKKDKPDMIIRHAVKGMLPHNRLGRRMFKKLFVYSGSEHPHQAQKPEELKL